MTRKGSDAGGSLGGPESRDSDVRARVERAGKGTWEIRPQTGEHLLSARSRELLGVDVEGAISVQRFVAALHPSDRERWKHVLAQLLHAEGCDEFHFTFRTAGRPERTLAASARAFFKGTRGARLVGSLEDITGQERVVHDEVPAGASDRLKRLLCGGVGAALRREGVALTDVCREAIDQAMLAHPGHHIELGGWEETFGVWDRELLVEVVRHLIASALGHSAAGEPIFVSVLDCGDGAELVVADKGRTTPHRLARILYEIVLAHGGWLEPSMEESGTTLRVWLPKVM